MSQDTTQVVTMEQKVTPDLINTFAEVSGDENPLHLDEEAAEEGPFGERIAHGMLTASFISAALAELDGEIIYTGQNLSFDRPVTIGDTLTIEVVTQGDGLNGSTTVSTNVVNQDDEQVIHGTAKVLIN